MNSPQSEQEARLAELVQRAERIIKTHGYLGWNVHRANVQGMSNAVLRWVKRDVTIALSRDGLEVRLRTPSDRPKFYRTSCVYFRYTAEGVDPYVNHELVEATLRNIDRHMVLDDLADV